MNQMMNPSVQKEQQQHNHHRPTKEVRGFPCTTPFYVVRSGTGSMNGNNNNDSCSGKTVIQLQVNSAVD